MRYDLFNMLNSIFELHCTVRVHMAHITSVQWAIHYVTRPTRCTTGDMIEFLLEFEPYWLLSRICLVNNRFSKENDDPFLSIDKVLYMSSCHMNSICHKGRIVSAK